MKMKTTFNNQHSTPNVQGDAARCRRVGVGRSALNVECSRVRQRGVALVITLIMLSVTLLMALAFLAMSNRERNAAATSTDAATARLASEAALNAAVGQIAANVLSSTNPYNFGLVVSTNQDTDDSFANLPNLFISPRAPVWLSNTVTHVMENRFYLDLNRNGVDDPNGWVTNVNQNGKSLGTVSFQVGDPEWIGLLEHPDQPYGPNNPFIARFAYIALPVGNSLDLNAIYNQVLDGNNQNATVNPAANSPGNVGADYFFRNQGVGTWELNLAAFLADLDTNQWPTYFYNEANPTNNFPNSGAAFDDARALLAYRYANNYNSLASVDNLFGGARGRGAGSIAFLKDNIDGYSDGPLQTGAHEPGDVTFPTVNDNPRLPWAGADNANHFFDLTADLFDPGKTAVGVPAGTANFQQRLQAAGSGVSTYDRGTFYRMLAQISTESAPESGRMNLNYDNVDPGFNGLLTTNGTASETNFVPWQPLTFFLNAADRLLKTYTTQWATAYVPVQTAPGATNVVAVLNPNFLATFNVANPFGVTNIPVLVSNRYVYTPAVQRLLQLAANIYDATSTSYYPSVFRPIFEHDNFGNVFIVGYAQVANVAGPDDPQLSAPVDVTSVANLTPASRRPWTPIRDANNNLVNVYGVPWIIGAKKGFPNFNAFSMESIFSLTRKLMLTRQRTDVSFASSPDAYTFEQQLTLGLTNYLQVQCWNSYRADYTHAQPMEIFATDWNTVLLTNDEGLFYPVSIRPIPPNANVITNSDWPGYGNGSYPQAASFLIPLQVGNILVPNLIYTFNPAQPFTTDPNAFFTTITRVPHWGLLVTNRLRVVMLEHNNFEPNGIFHVIDYAQLMGPGGGHDMSADIQRLYDTQINPYYDDQWDTNVINIGGNINIATGLGNQFSVSAGLTPVIQDPYWTQQDPAQVANQIAVFRGFLGLGLLAGESSQSYNLGKGSFWQQAPYSPTALVAYITQWGANDPLVHYLASDLTDLNASTAAQAHSVAFPTGVVNGRYRPWGGNPEGYDPYPYNSALKDPMVPLPGRLVDGSDNWDFPTNKLATVGWLSRVHRGTPWQTVYLKSADVLSTVNGLNAWMNVTGDSNPYDAANMAPLQDRLLFDLFTTAFNDNATRGQLSVNAGAGSPDPVSGLASWSALFSGMVVPTNAISGYTVIGPAGPAGVRSPLGMLVTNINFTRLNFRNSDGLTGVFEHTGDILSAPTLTDQSPFLARLDPNTQITDEMAEWLPQQMMSLLRVGSPRYVIYAYGQGLKPAQGAVYTGSGPSFGMVTNYQVVSETAARAVVRMETTRTNVFNGTNYTITVTPPHAVIESYNILPPD
jgi:hypothetical protein